MNGFSRNTCIWQGRLAWNDAPVAVTGGTIKWILSVTVYGGQLCLTDNSGDPVFTGVGMYTCTHSENNQIYVGNP